MQSFPLTAKLAVVFPAFHHQDTSKSKSNGRKSGMLERVSKVLSLQVRPVESASNWRESLPKKGSTS